MSPVGFAVGVGLGLAVAWATQALPQVRGSFDEGDHHEMAWTVLAAGQVVCVAPFVRPSAREIECRSARPS
ncbi:hypothetical protein [Phenylobacterium sp.]|uniref:hypothetical protein n=1 Tax=Phenylobacterium sp. TaxID=1871053 RepID=UPI002F41C034